MAKTLTTHQLARQLLLLEDKPVVAYDGNIDDYVNVDGVTDNDGVYAAVIELNDDFDERQW